MGGYFGKGNNRNTESLESLVFNRFKQFLSKDFVIKKQINWEVDNQLSFFDLVIFKKNEPIAIIEIKNKLLEDDKDNYLVFCENTINLTNASFCIITDNNLFYFYQRNKNEVIKYTFDEIISQINNIKFSSVNPKQIETVLKIIKETANKYLNENEVFINYIQYNLSTNIIGFDEYKNCFYFIESENNNFNSFENIFFTYLLGEFKAKTIYRYTTLNTLFESIKNLSFRMSGIVGMNDKSETNFVDHYIQKKESKIISEKPLNLKHHNTISSLNKRYISSCSTRKDDLTLWRLYGDDAKGVCLGFKINTEKNNSSFLINKVKYANSKGELKELDFIAEIIRNVKSETNYNFEFRKLKIWRHFFKPYEYEIEKEIRILAIDNEFLEKINEDWVLTNSNSIINPVIDFRLNDLKSPFQLNEIIIGPKCPEKTTNLVQIREMIMRKNIEIKANKLNSNLSGIKVLPSKIEHYR